MTGSPADFRLIETMRVLKNGEVYLLDRHLDRLIRSAQYFSFTCDARSLREKILQAIPRDGNPACVRLTLSKDGVVFLESGPLPATHVRRLRLSSVRVDSTDPFLRHKTTNRAVYEAARQECDAQTDALLSNERSEITETTIMNVALFREGRWVTPAISCGLLPGVMREELLARGEIAEGVILVNSIRDGEPIRCFNALRGTYEVALGPQTN